ncbi:MAG: DUF2059 domain-containing protein [Chitinophagaceae bacterium]
MKKRILILLLSLLGQAANAQDSSSVFESISKAMKEYVLETSEVPADKITAAIKELRSLKGGFNINEVVEFKISESIQKNEGSKDELLQLSRSFQNGLGKKWLDNAVTWIYRKHFTYEELKAMVKFYKTSAGQKMAKEFPVVMLNSLAAAETIQKILTKK